MEEYNRGDWWMCFCQCQAEVVISGVIQQVTSGGLGGVESDYDEDYFKEIKKEQMSELSGILRQLGFTLKQVNAAFKEMTEE
jgi:hypothetical protein